MDILGVGIPELFFVLLIALILLGPKDMLNASKTLGRMLRNFIQSPTWQAMRSTGRELQQLPTKLMREANLEDLEKEVRGIRNEVAGTARQIRPTFDEKNIFGQTPTLKSPPPPAAPVAETPPPPDSPSA